MDYTTILECTVGSTLHGTAVEDGLEDLDLMAIVVESQENFCGFGYITNDGEEFYPKDVWTWRTKPEGVRSEAGDTDWVGYGLKKWMQLAMKGNPTVLLPLFAPERMLRTATPAGMDLRKLWPLIISKKMYPAYKGYIKQQKERLIGTRGQMNVTRPELIEKYGYDTKYASHVVRLCTQGVEILTTGRLTLPMKEQDRQFIVGVRNGRFEFNDVIETIACGESALHVAFKASTLRDEPAYADLQKWMLDIYYRYWSYEAR